jgi:hypothetical protein
VNPLTRKQFELNQTSSGDWKSFAGHRDRVTELLGNGANGDGRLCILGAGNCNDLDLPAIAAAFEQVVLVDLDKEAMLRGMISQPLQVADRLRCLGETDITGVLSRIAMWLPSTQLQPDDLFALAAGAQTSDWPVAPHFDVVASTCLLSQLIGSLSLTLTDRHPQFLDAVKAIRTGHLWTMASLLRPGGRAALIIDVVSSDTLPELTMTSDADAPRLVDAAIKAGNFFTGLNPAVIHGFIKSSPMFENVAFVPPWIWHCGPRAYAVYALLATRAS